MFGTVAILLLSAAPLDPRPALVHLQLEGRWGEALERVEREIAERREPSSSYGLDYLRGTLLERLGQDKEAGDAFLEALSSTPRLKLYSLYRLALEHERRSHPEVSVGLMATGISKEDPRSPLMPQVVRLLVRTLDRRGDCRMLRDLPLAQLPLPERRLLYLAQARCDRKEERPERARRIAIDLLAEKRDDEAARGAAELLAGMLPQDEGGRGAILVGQTFHLHRDFGRALIFLSRPRTGALSHEALEARYALGSCLLILRRFQNAVASFAETARMAGQPAAQARALYHQGHAYEIAGNWRAATQSFQQAWRIAPSTEWAAAALAAALRLQWRAGNEAAARASYEQLRADPRASFQAGRAALEIAASELVRGRREPAEKWLKEAAASRENRIEIEYWKGRAAELANDREQAVLAYREVIQADPNGPLARAAAERMEEEPLAAHATGVGRRLAGSATLADLYGAFLLLKPDDPAHRAARSRLQTLLSRDRRAAPYLRMREVAVAQWPLWSAPLERPEEMALALGVLPEGAPAIAGHFPLSSPSLALTGARLHARYHNGVARTVEIAEALRGRMPPYLPIEMLPRPYQQILFPLPASEALIAISRQRKLDPALLAALVRTESYSSLRVPVRAGLVEAGGSPMESAAAALEIALRDTGGVPHVALAALSAGGYQANFWRSLCFGNEPEEYLTKIGSARTREYVRGVLADAQVYRRLYGL